MVAKHFRGVGVAIAATALATALATPAFAARPPEPIPSREDVELGEQVDLKVDVVVILKNQPTTPSASAESSNIKGQAPILQDWKSKYGVEIRRQFGYLVNGFSASVPADKLLELSKDSRVESVRRERLYETTENTARELQGVPAAYEDFGVDGTGTVVAIVDTGIDIEHQDMRLDSETASSCGPDVKLQPKPGFTCKVPNGYNYIDENSVVKDTTSSQHGMHVAGIVGANGSVGDATAAEAGRVDGVAPNAQLLAMKVFSNDGSGWAYDSDIIAAIEDSVKMGADVINMSLGSTNGMNYASDGTYRAMAKAREAGVLTVVSAGNEGLNFSATGENDDYLGFFDDGVVGAPGSQESAFTVASIENTYGMVKYAFINDEADGVTYNPQSGPAFDGTTYEVLDAGLGYPEDFVGDFEGKVALIERGEIGFADKLANAEAAGAAGAIVFNHADGGEELINMAGTDEVSIPSVFFGNAAGSHLLSLIEENGSATIRFAQEPVFEPNDAALTPSSFTSWGPTPGLEFKPQIAGIGGQVYSTLNNNSYGSMSGTSMAAPNVSGMSALMLEDFKERFEGRPQSELIGLTEIALMNTAEILVDENGVPFPPRQIGAGLGRVDRALETNVIATVDGYPSVALHEVNEPSSIEVLLTNYGSSAVTYDVPAQQVLTDDENEDWWYVGFLSDATLTANKNTVTVPANGTATVTFTLDPSVGDEGFLQGWARLESTTAGAPDLAVPYLGLKGDWNEEPIVQEPYEEFFWFSDDIDPDNPISLRTTELVTDIYGAAVLGSELDEYVWISPNGDELFDAVFPSIFQLRNASDMEYEIRDAAGNVVTKIGAEQELPRTHLADIANPEQEPTNVALGYAFDGTVWDAQAGDFTIVPDGEYSYVIKARLSADFDWQEYELPFGIDTVAPVIELGDVDEDGVLTVTVTDEGGGSGVYEEIDVELAGGIAVDDVTQVDENTWEITLPAGATSPFLIVVAYDNALNEATAAKSLASGIAVLGEDEITSGVLGEFGPYTVAGDLHLEGFASDDVAWVTVEGDEVEVEDGRFYALHTLTEGSQQIEIVAYNAAGDEIDTKTLVVVYDGTPPVLDITSLNSDGELDLNDDGTVTIAGTLRDERDDAELSLYVDGEEIYIAPNGSFDHDYEPWDDDYYVSLEFSDGANFDYESLLIAGREHNAGSDWWWEPYITNVDCIGLSACFVEGDHPDISEDGTEFTVYGEIDDPVSSIVFTPGSRATDDGSLTQPEPIAATIDSGWGEFEATLPMAGTGENDFRIVVTAADGEVMIDQAITFYFDVVAPTITFDEPTLRAGALITDEEQVTFAGTASDDGWGYTLRLNNSAVLDLFHNSGLGPDSNQRDFSTDLTVANGDTLLLTLNDANGNALAGLVPVVLDQVAPEIEISGGNPLLRAGNASTIEVTATDDQLASLTVLLDGDEVDSQSAPALVEQQIEDALVDLRHGEPEAPELDFDTEYSTSISTVELAFGQHTLVAVSTDVVGHSTAETYVFMVDHAPVIDGPDEVDLEVYRELLADQDALAARVLAEFTASDDDPDAEPSLELAPLTVIGEGENTVIVIATDSAGQRTEHEVTVNVTLKQVTLTDGDVTATSTFRSDDKLTATLVAAAPGKPGTLTISNKEEFSARTAVITIPAEEGTKVYLKLEDGSLQPVPSSWADGMLTFTGSSKATYVLKVAAATDPGGDPGDNGSGTPSPGGNGGTSSPGGGNTPGTGAEPLPLVLTALALLGAGSGFIWWKRRRALA
ncbi:lactocepin [Ruaniaceae bacterium KH17]|nr:lactocepin [Ruaniaceae bacterium KH17]